MSAPSDSTVKGTFNEVLGKAEQSIGEAVGNQNLANKGAAHEVEGHAQQAWGSVKEGASDLKTQHEAEAAEKGHNFRDEITSAAEHVKDSVQAGIDHLKHKSNS